MRLNCSSLIQPGQAPTNKAEKLLEHKIICGRTMDGRRPELVYQNILDLVSAWDGRGRGEHVNNITHPLIVQCLARQERNQP